MNAANVLVTPMFIAEALRFPEGTRITAAGMDEQGHIVLTVQHAALKDQPYGVIGFAQPQFERAERQVHDVDFKGWGQR